MQDHNPRHQSTILMAGRYKTFFADLSENYQGRTVYLYPDAHLEHTSGDADPVELRGFAIEHKKRKDHITIQTAVDRTPQELTMIANMIWVIRDEDSNIIALEIIDPQDKKLVLEFGE